MGHDSPLEQTSPLYFEMYICSEILKGMTHEEFSKLSFEEKTKWKLFTSLKFKKEEYSMKKITEKHKVKQSGRTPKSKTRR